MSETPTPPEVGSLWEHESGERRFVLAVWNSGLSETPMVRSHALYELDGEMRNAGLVERLAVWHAWAANARRIA
jgi:hypothetical protein